MDGMQPGGWTATGERTGNGQKVTPRASGRLASLTAWMGSKMSSVMKNVTTFAKKTQVAFSSLCVIISVKMSFHRAPFHIISKLKS